MTIKLRTENGGRLLNIRVTEKLTAEDYAHFVPEFERLLEQHGKLDVRFDMTDFQGWTLGALWEDTKFALHHFRDIERLAIIGDKRWQQGMAAFCKPFTRAEVRYFDIDDAGEATDWLERRYAA